MTSQSILAGVLEVMVLVMNIDADLAVLFERRGLMRVDRAMESAGRRTSRGGGIGDVG